ncbi:hypothetical protein [Shimia sp.]|uniref:hypothetical protein n=1 Tax=Shimia sp. TaxID=1954381 RepID=UPI003BAACD1C
MMRFLTVAAMSVAAGAASAQAPEGWIFSFDGAYLNQDSSDTNGGGSFSADRVYSRVGAFKRNPGGISYGVSATFGQSDYDFSGMPALWDKVDERSVTVSLAGRTANGMRWFVAPSVRSRYASGASASDGRSAGLFAGVSWEVGDNLVIGPAFGAFEGLGGDDYDAFPALLLDWEFANRWSLSTGPTLGASQGPGLSLRYDVSDTWGLTLSARQETNRFALAGGNVGQDKSVPVVMSLSYDPNPGMSFVVFAGAEVDGSLAVENATGATLSKQSYDTAPLMGVAFSLSF